MTKTSDNVSVDLDLFQRRDCPYCRSNNSANLFKLKASDFCDTNWSYSNNYREILSLKGEENFPIGRCRSCGFVYAVLLPPDFFLERLYDEVIDIRLAEGGSKESGDYARRLRYVAQLVRLVDDVNVAKILDFGSGYGITSKLFSLIDLDVYAFDPSKARTSIAKEANIKTIDSLVTISQKAVFDIVVCDNVLEHVVDIHETAGFFSKIMKQGGLAYISVPSYESKSIDALLTDYAAGDLSDMTLNPWEHLNYFDLEHLDGLMGEHGFVALSQTELVETVDIGLRPETDFSRRWKNSLASLVRLIRYLVNESAVETVNNRFYRYRG